MSHIVHHLIAPVLVSLLMTTTAASAAPPKDRKAEADALFEQANELRDKGDLATVCSLLDRAWKLDPTDGTLFALADCREREGKIGTALRLFREYLDPSRGLTGSRTRAAESVWARKRIKELEGVVPTLRVSSKAFLPSDIQVLANGQPITLNKIEPLDPGEHQVVVQRDGKSLANWTVKLVKGDPTIELTIALDIVAQDSRESSKLPVPWKPVTVIAFGAMAVGSAALVAGGILGGLAVTQASIVDDECDELRRCSNAGIEAVQKTATYGHPSTALLIGGGAVAGAGLITWLVTSRGGRENRTDVRAWFHAAPGNAFIGVKGVF